MSTRWYRSHSATNAPIRPDPYTMLALPEAGFLTRGVALYRQNDLDGAEESFKKMLHHNPEHAACNYMVGMVCLRKNHLKKGIVFIEKALKKAPWHKDWHQNLLKACELAGKDYKSEAACSKNEHGIDLCCKTQIM